MGVVVSVEAKKGNRRGQPDGDDDSFSTVVLGTHVASRVGHLDRNGVDVFNELLGVGKDEHLSMTLPPPSKELIL